MSFIPNISIKTRISLGLACALIVALCSLSLNTYIFMAQKMWDPGPPYSVKFTTFTLATPYTKAIYSANQYSVLMSYSLDEEFVGKIKNSTQSVIHLGTPFGLVSVDQKMFITPEVSGPQVITIYGRPSLNDPYTLEMIFILHSTTASNDSAALARIFWYTTPATILILGFAGFWILKSLFKRAAIMINTNQED